MTMPATTETSDLVATTGGHEDRAPIRAVPRDADHFERIDAALKGIESAQEELLHAVSRARAAGESWAVIGTALGISRQAAWERFAGKVSGSEDGDRPAGA